VTNANRLRAPASFRHRPSEVRAAVAEAFAASATVVDLGRALKLQVAALAGEDFAVRTPIIGSNLTTNEILLIFLAKKLYIIFSSIKIFARRKVSGILPLSFYFLACYLHSKLEKMQ
jgi:hypothetical protein